MSKATIKGFFNPRHAGDTFKGLNGSIDGTLAPTIIQDLRAFLKAAGRDYYIRKDPVYQKFGTDFAEVENQFHLTRSSDSRVVSPHTVTESYEPLSLMDMADELQPWCDQGWTTPDGVYSARNESLELLTLRLDAGGISMPDDEKFMHYIIFENPHASGGKAKGKIISWRVVCANTFAAAISAKSDFQITHRVAKGTPEEQQAIMATRTKDAVAAWEQAREYIRTLADRIAVMKAAKITKADAANLTAKLLGIEGDKEEDISSRSKNRRDAILAGFNMPGFGTFGVSAYDWLNAVTFVNSSPLATINKKSKVDAVDRLVRNVTTNGTGFKMEADANSVLAEFIG